MDVSHELGALRFVVDSPLSSKVAMFNQQVNQHKQSQLLNPFANNDGRASPKPTFSKDEYGKPLAGSLTEARGQKANMHVMREMLELCQIIDSEGYNVKDEPTMRVIPFGELFNIYNYISDKCVGILLRARKHKLVEFEGEMLFQRRDDDVPIFLLKPIHEIRHELTDKIDSIKRCGSPAPQATSVLLDKKAHGLDLPKGATPRNSVSRTPSPPSKADAAKTETAKTETAKTEPAKPEAPKTESPKTETAKTESEASKTETTTTPAPVAATVTPKIQLSGDSAETKKSEVEEKPAETSPQTSPASEVKEQTKPVEVAAQETPVQVAEPAKTETKTDVNNNDNELPTIVIEATAVYERPAKTEQTSETPATTTVPVQESNAPSEPTPSA